MENTYMNFRKGQLVKTSKGKIGIVKEPSHIEVGYHNDEGEWVLIRGYAYNDLGRAISTKVAERESDMLNKQVINVVIPNKVKLGKNIYSVWDDKLEPITSVTIQVQETIKLNAGSAEQLIELLEHNKIWYHFI